MIGAKDSGCRAIRGARRTANDEAIYGDANPAPDRAHVETQETKRHARMIETFSSACARRSSSHDATCWKAETSAWVYGLGRGLYLRPSLCLSHRSSDCVSELGVCVLTTSIVDRDNVTV